MIAPFCFVKLIDEKYFINKLILKISCMINIIALSLTLSRGAIISVFIGIILSSILNKNYKILKITIFIFILAISLSPSLRDRIFSIVNVFKSETVSVGGDYSSTEVRKELIKISIRSIRENPLGIGLGNYGEITRIYGLKEVGASHNDYLQMAVETGIQGLISFILIIYYIFKSLVYVRNDIIYDYKVLYEGIVASFISVVFYLNFINAYNTLILWFILGISVYFERIIREEKNRKAIR
jgi:O-antigen ligase